MPAQNEIFQQASFMKVIKGNNSKHKINQRKGMKFGTDQKQGRTKKNTYQFNVDRDRKIQISSNFDGGNISLIKQVTQLQYRLQSVPDSPTSSNKKCWFYFSVSAPKNFRLRFHIEGISIYQSMYQEENWGKPVFKIGQEGKWQTLKDSHLIVFFFQGQYRDEVNLMIDYHFQSVSTIYFAMSIPFTYWQMESYLNDMKYLVPDSLSFKDQIIKQTKTGKNLHMLTFEDKSLKAYKQSSNTGRCIILVTSRVHPGEVSGTYCLQGMLNFILRPFSLQSEIFRKMFTFVVIPMVNPEGVYEGNYRMDLNGQNLNRVYLDPHPSKNETVYAIKEKISDLLKQGDRIMFHFDLHSHSNLRRSFIYGNAFDDIIVQTQTQVFCRLLDRNCQYFQESLCQFGQKHMKFKDKGQLMSKQGCARVVLSKMASIVYSYTVESSIFPIQPKQFSQKYQKYESINMDFKVQQISGNFQYDDFEDNDRKYTQEPNIVDQNKNLGAKIMVSILEIVRKNPYSYLDEKEFDEIKKSMACRILQNEERFKMLDTKAYHKSKFISQFSKTQFENKYKDEWSWLSTQKQFLNIKWPEKFSWFKQVMLNNVKNKTRKYSKTKTESRQTKIYALSQNDVSSFKLFPDAITNRLKMNTEIEDLKEDFRRLPLIRKSMQTKRTKTDQREEFEDKKLENTENYKLFKNVLISNRSNILLTFLDQLQQKKQAKKLSKKRIMSLKMASLNRNPAQKISNDQKDEKPVLPIQNDFQGLQPSHSQGQLSIHAYLEGQKTNDEEGSQFEDKMILKHGQNKNSRKQLLNKKISMLKKINESRKQANKNSLMKFPQIGKAFLITNAQRKFQKLKTTLEQNEKYEKSTIQSNQKNEKPEKREQESNPNERFKNLRVQTEGILVLKGK